MSLSRAEIPAPGSAERPAQRGFESLPKVTRLNRGLYALVFYILGIALLLLILGWIALAALGKSVPDGMPVVIATIVGALTGVIAADSKAGGQ
jgi:uncharacterized membrane protein (DUF485 family)